MMAIMSLMERIERPGDLRRLSTRQLTLLAEEIRSFLITNVSRTGGHLGPNLGAVELTIGLHRVFNSPHDPIIFDTGHQSYVHKILTGRASRFPTLRQQDGLSGYPSRDESEHDWESNSHASSSISWGEGMAKAFHLRGEDRTVVVFIGDGALTGGMAWEALNNIAAQPWLKIVIVVNDNGRSYTPTVGGLANHLSALRTDRRYEKTLEVVKAGVSKTPVVGKAAYDVLHGMKTGLKDVLAPQGMFSDLGMKYIGPIDGHDIDAVIRGFDQAKRFGGPVIVHCVTRKGNGFKAAEDHEEDRFHAVGKIDEHTGEPISGSGNVTWTDAFGEEMVQLGERYPDVVAITAAMMNPTGLGDFAAAFPDRCFDVGIAEQHATASAAGMARAGLHPVFAVYATFLNRAFDQVLMDVALHRLGVTFVLDRAGVTGPDGASHNGVWDLAMLSIVPGMHLAAPRDRRRLHEALERAVTISNAPTVIRFSKDRLPADVEAIQRQGGVDHLRIGTDPTVLLVAYGQFVHMALQVADRLEAQGIGVSVVDPVWALPVAEPLVELTRGYQLVVTLEDGLADGGVGALLGQRMRRAGIDVATRHVGVPTSFLDQGTREQVLSRVGLTAQDVARSITESYATLDRAPVIRESVID